MSRNSLKSVIKLIQSAKEELPVEQSFLNDLKRSIEIDDSKEYRLPSQTYKPSGMNCIRQSYYQLVGVKPDETQQSYTIIGICNSGTDIHERIQKAVAGMVGNDMDCEYVDVAGYVLSRGLSDIDIVSKQGMETKLYNSKYNISFLCDGIIKYKGRYYILEIKTESSYKWSNRTAVDPGHYNQATAYSLSLGINDVLFVYINRDIFDMKSYLFTVTDDMKQQLVAYILECDKYLEDKVTPPKPYLVAKKTCEYCMYKNLCRQQEV